MPIPIAKEIFGFVVSKYNKSKKIKNISIEGENHWGKSKQNSTKKVNEKRRPFKPDMNFVS